MPTRTAKKRARICVLINGEAWAGASEKGCTSGRHKHMSYEHAARLVMDGKMEWVKGAIWVNGEEIRIDVPAARFTQPRVWRKRMSRGDGGPVSVMQLVP